VPVTWYLNAPYSIPDGVSRFYWYGFSGTPSVMFDGNTPVVGGSASGSMYSSYQPIVQNHLGDPSPLQMVGSYALYGVTGSVDIQITVTAPITTTSNRVRLVVVENGAHGQVNLARLYLPEAAFTLTDVGQSMTIHRDFAIDGGWNLDNLGVVAFVQSDAGDKPVLQCVAAQADYVGTIVVDAEPDGLEAEWTLTGPGGYLYHGVDDRALQVFLAGDYTITWEPIPGWDPPSPAQETRTLVQDGQVTFVGQYGNPPFTAVTDAEMGHQLQAARGVAMWDIDRDGDLDIYVTAPGEPNVWFRNDGGGNWTAVTTGELAVDGQDMAAVFCDYDGDGRADLYVVRYGEPNLLLHDDGGSWHDAAYGDAADAGAGVAASWADYDGNGLPDLYVVNNGGESRLLKSYGDFGGENWFFLKASGPPTSTGPASAGIWGDYDGDGDPDFYQVNASAANALYRNDHPYGFSEPTGASVLADNGVGAAAAWGDYDNDGDLDLYLSNDGGLDHLFVNAAGSFSQVPGDNLADAGHGRGVAWGDFDNDGDLDLYLVRHGEYDRLLRNDGGGVFTRIPLGIAGTGGLGNGCAWGDVDGDGDLDLFVANEGGPSLLLLNNLQGGQHWLHVDLVGTTANTGAVGARVRVVAGGVRQLREVTAGTGYASQESPTLEFGLGTASVVDSLYVRWPDGSTLLLTGVPVDRKQTIVQGGSTAVPGPAPWAGVELARPYPNPFNPEVAIGYTLAAAGPVSLEVFDGRGRRVRTLHDGPQDAGGHRVVWRGRDDDGRPLASGTYLVRLRAAGVQRTTTVTLVK